MDWFRETWVYIVRGCGGQVLYVGMSKQPRARLDDHKRRAPWYDLAEAVEFTAYPSRGEAYAAERLAIEQMRPTYNKIHNARFARNGYAFVEATK